MSAALAGVTALNGLALYAAHHVGDYWVQTDHQSANKGKAGDEGVRACVAHVCTYTVTQAVFVSGAALVVGYRCNVLAFMCALLVSAITHYLADRREYGLMFAVARAIPGKEQFLTLGRPRDGLPAYSREDGSIVVHDNPTLATGAWALDQSWHIFWGVFVAALIMSVGAA
jgi:hypothetical protein